MNKKGFTLVELLAVVLIIGIVLAITFTVVNNQVKKAHYRATKVNAEVYIKEVNNKATISRMESVKISEGVFSVNSLKELGIQVNGTNPDSGFVMITNYKVLNGCLKYDKYKVDIINGKAQETEKGSCSLSSEMAVSKEIEYSSSKQNDTFEIPITGTYKIEVWGAQGGDATANYEAEGGYGGYATVTFNFNRGDVLYLYPGGKGESSNSVGEAVRSGGYNGGGNAKSNGNTAFGAGGGASHVALVPGLLKNISSDKVLVVAGGGGGAGSFGNSTNYGGYGGGCEGTMGSGGSSGYGGTQSIGGSGRGSGTPVAGTYGQGGSATWGSGGGAGFYGGGTGYDTGSSAGGGSGYINNTATGFVSGTMYSSSFFSDGTCESQAFTNYTSEPVAGAAKSGNGYIKIQLQI